MINNFKDFGYVQVPEFIDKQSINTISQYFENKIKRGEWLSKEIEVETNNTENFEKINQMISTAKLSFDIKTGILTLQSENQEMPSLVVDLTKSEYKLL